MKMWFNHGSILVLQMPVKATWHIDTLKFQHNFCNQGHLTNSWWISDVQPNPLWETII